MTRRFDRAAILLAVLVVWQAVHWSMGGTALASPAEALARLATLVTRAGFQADTIATGSAFLLAAGISVTAGVALGCMLGLVRLLGHVIEPVLAAFYALPKVTLYPVVLLLFGLGFSAKVAFGVMHGLIPISLITMNAVLQVHPVHLRAARAMRLGTVETIRIVVLPSILPDILGGIRIGVPLALLGVLIGEMFASRRGLGSVAMRAMEAADSPTLLAISILLSAAALAINALLTRLAATRSMPSGQA